MNATLEQHGAGALQVMVRGLRAGARQDGGALASWRVVAEIGMPADLYETVPGAARSRLSLAMCRKGGENSSLNEVAEYKRGSVSWPPSKQPRELFEHYSIPAFDKGEQPSIDLGENIKSNKTIVPLGAVLLSKLNPHISRVWIPDSLSHRVQISSTEFLPFTPRPPAGQGLLYCLLSGRSAFG